MKKNILIILLSLIVIILISLYLMLDNKDINNTMTIYQTALNFNEFENAPMLQKDDLKIELLDFFINGQTSNNLNSISENEKKEFNCVQRVKFSTEKPIQSVIFDYLVYDNNGNILSTNIYGDYPKKEELYLVKSYLNKYIFNSTDNTSYMNRILNSSYAFERIQNLEETTSKDLTMSVIGFKRDNEKYEDNFNKIHILIINPKYQEYGNSDFSQVSNTIFEFILTK